MKHWADLPIEEQIILALRAQRRADDASQRAFAAARGWHRSLISRLETRPGELKLAQVANALDTTPYRLHLTGERSLPELEETDLVARDRAGRRFPATRQVQPSPIGPNWWWHNEALAPGVARPAPRWSAEGWWVKGEVEALVRELKAARERNLGRG